jgi:regulation of enolase protein 1 (concanavalin A-like superfamily)
MPAFEIPAIPGELDWKNSPLNWKVDPAGRLTILAGENTDWFVDPGGAPGKDNAPAALFSPPDPDFILSARVAVDFASTFDAGVLQVRVDEALWAKLCFEYSPQGQPMVVSVVTRGRSDDCNSAVITGGQVHLRMAVTPQTIGFHYSLDGGFWHFVRYFTLGQVPRLRAGFSAQSPTGAGCRVVFSDIHYQAGRLADFRNGA